MLRSRFSWPDGQRVFDGLNVTVGPGRTGLIGTNGSGKSTLLRLVAGELRPGSGSVTVAGTLGYLPRNITLRERLRVDEVLGIARMRAALAAIEAGDTDAGHFTTVGDDWDVEERARDDEVRIDLPATVVPPRKTVAVLENVDRFAPRSPHNAIRAHLARLLFPGERADQLVATLSGGELFRATLAALLLAQPAPRLLMLDEPTNNLDLPSVRTLTQIDPP